MIWAALDTLMQTSLRSGYDLIGDICPDHIDICADHCRSLFLAHRYHGSSIRCPAFLVHILKQHVILGLQTVLALLFRWRMSSAELIALSAKAIEQIIRTDKKDRIVSRTDWNILSRLDLTKREWMDGWNRYLKRCPSNIEGSSPCQSPKLTFNEPLWVASLAHPHCSSGNNLVLHESGKAGVQRRLIGGWSVWSQLCLRQSLITA